MDMDMERLALELLPTHWREAAEGRIGESEELRFRIGRRPVMLLYGEEQPFSGDLVSDKDLLRILEKATGASLHSAQNSLSEGYVNYRGIRIGVCGVAAMKSGETSVFHHVSSLALRIPREYRGICREEIDLLLRENQRSTLVVGPPGAGKTTALREIIRRYSDSGYRVSVADERNELAAWDGEGQTFALGRCTDVLCGLPKEKAAMMLLRGMNPDLIAMDEISQEEDQDVLFQITGCGVGILASAHGTGTEDLLRREAYRRLLRAGIFSRILVVHRTNQGRKYRLENCNT